MKRTAYGSAAMAIGAFLLWTVPAPAEAQRAVPREQTGDSGGSGTSSGGGDRAVPRATAPSPSPGGSSADRPSGRDSSSPRSGASDGQSRSVPPYSRPRGDNVPRGEAVERRGAPPGRGSGAIVIPDDYYYGGYYPWGYGGFGLAGYYGGYYDPWYYGSYYPGDYSRRDDGAVRLKVKPEEAEVYVDGYYAGRVDDFDGIFQRLRIEPGPHRIEMRADGYAPLVFEVRVLPDRTITYEGELKPAP